MSDVGMENILANIIKVFLPLRFVKSLSEFGTVCCSTTSLIFFSPLLTFQIGIDASAHLAEECSRRGFQVLTGNCLNLPFRSSIADGVLCIAVIHHLATHVSWSPLHHSKSPVT